MFSKKYLGQHFLQNKGKLLKIVRAIDPDISYVIEIGSGRGELTQYLLTAGFKVIGIEKDVDMIPILKEKFNSEIKVGKLEIIQGDVLSEIPKFKSHLSNEKKYAVVGNIPYYITGRLLRILGELSHKPKQIIFLIQKEVAERVCASDGNMNLLAASVGWWANARVITQVPRNMFSPPPKVDSAIVELKTRSIKYEVWNMKQETQNVEYDAYVKCIHAVFKQPRRTIIKNLVDAGIKRIQAENALTHMGLTLTTRPQELSIENIIKLSGLFC